MSLSNTPAEQQVTLRVRDSEMEKENMFDWIRKEHWDNSMLELQFF